MRKSRVHVKGGKIQRLSPEEVAKLSKEKVREGIKEREHQGSTQDELHQLMMSIAQLQQQLATQGQQVGGSMYPNIRHEKKVKRLNYLVHLGMQLQSYDPELVGRLVGGRHMMKPIEKTEVVRFLKEAEKEGFDPNLYGNSTTLARMFKKWKEAKKLDENLMKIQSKRAKKPAKQSPQKKSIKRNPTRQEIGEEGGLKIL